MNQENIAAPARPAWAVPLAWTAAACLFTALTLVYFWPLPRIWQDSLGPDPGDPIFNLYVLKWGVHEIRLGLPNLWNGNVWNANIFYPTRGTLALSDHLLGPAAELALFETVIPNAIAGYNFLFLSSFIASALATCWVLRRSGLSWMAALLGGWMFSYSSFRVSQMPHLQILIAQWIPLTLWFWDRLLTGRTAKNAVLFLLFYLLNLSGGCYYAYMIHFPLAAILASRALEQRWELISLRSLRVLVPVMLVAAAAVAALFLPYARISHELGITRTREEVREFGATPVSYFSPSFQNFYFDDPARAFLDRVLGPARAKLFVRPENALFAGFLPTIFFFVGAVAAWRGWRDGPRDVWARGLALSGIVCFALSLTVVYSKLFHTIPGLSGMRVPARFYAFVSVTLVYFAARGVDLLLRRLPAGARVAVAVGIGAALVVELNPGPVDWQPLPREEALPAVYTWIRNEPTVHSLIEIPLLAGDIHENRYVYASTVHWKPIANGYSGYTPQSHRDLEARIYLLPGIRGLALLRDMGISHIVVHVEPSLGLGLKEIHGWERRQTAGPVLQMEKVYAAEDGKTFVYRVLGAPAAQP